MSLLDLLSVREEWERYYAYKASLGGPSGRLEELRAFIDKEEYLPVCAGIMAGEPFPLPRKAAISKRSTQKKRTVYVYPRAHTMVLKLLTYLLLRRYDHLFPENLHSFRPGHSAQQAFRALSGRPGISALWSYKTDVSNYFNSIDIDAFYPLLARTLSDDPALLGFLGGLLREPRVLDGGERITEQKGIMAGTPQACFYANLYLRDLDLKFAGTDIPYARYSDDIILFAPSRGETEELAREVRAHLAGKGLKVNPDKEVLAPPQEGFVFLGYRYREGEVDIAPASVRKIMGKMRRKTRALERWRKRNSLEGRHAATAFIRVFNRKLLENAGERDLTWSRWYFPMITTDESLRRIDHYAQDCIRYLLTGKRTKGRFDARYADIRALGYRSLVHEYYAEAE